MTQEELKKLMWYNPNTGVFRWLVHRNSRGGKVRPGVEVGNFMTGAGLTRYKETAIDGERFLLHRLAFLYMTGELPPAEVDHINGDGTDNRWVNLRLATSSQNKMNVRLKANNTSGYRGVIWHRKGKKWQASIKVHGKDHYLGLFSTPEEAHAVWMKAAKQRFGEFVCLQEVT